MPGTAPFMIAVITAPRGGENDGPVLGDSMVARLGIGDASSVMATISSEPRMPQVIPPESCVESLNPQVPGDAELIVRVKLASQELLLIDWPAGVPGPVRLFRLNAQLC